MRRFISDLVAGLLLLAAMWFLYRAAVLLSDSVGRLERLVAP